MSYNKQNFTSGQVLTANHLNTMSAGVDSKQNKLGNSYIHMSFDDVTSVVTDLAAGTLNSAFDNSFLAALKEAHEKYGFVFSLYIQTAPSTISTKYQSELREASSWLKWSLHSLNGGNYQSASYSTGKSDWNKMVNVVLQLTGTHEAVDRIPRLHQFYGSKDALTGMRDASLGALGFLSTDDTRKAYYLSDDQLNYLYSGENDHLTDFENGLVFYRTDLRLDWFSSAGFTYNAAAGMSNHEPVDASNIKGELERRYADSQYMNTWDCYVIFTHQWQPISAIQSALNSIGKFANERGIPFDFPQNHIARLTPYDIYPAMTGSSSGGGSSSEEATEITFAYNGNSRTLAVVDSPSEMVYEAGLSTAGGVATYFIETTGRAASTTTALRATGGQTVSLNNVISGVNLSYSLKCLSDANSSIASENETFRASSWLTSSATLPEGTKYVVIAFKRGDGNTDFTPEEVALLPNAITLS